MSGNDEEDMDVAADQTAPAMFLFCPRGWWGLQNEPQGGKWAKGITAGILGELLWDCRGESPILSGFYQDFTMSLQGTRGWGFAGFVSSLGEEFAQAVLEEHKDSEVFSCSLGDAKMQVLEGPRVLGRGWSSTSGMFLTLRHSSATTKCAKKILNFL